MVVDESGHHRATPDINNDRSAARGVAYSFLRAYGGDASSTQQHRLCDRVTLVDGPYDAVDDNDVLCLAHVASPLTMVSSPPRRR